MKSILLASASLFAFAGVAAAEVSFSGDTTFYYNDTDSRYDADGNTADDVDDEGSDSGFGWTGSLSAMLTQELDYGVTAGVEFGVDFVDVDPAGENSGTADALGLDLESADFTLSVTSDMGGFYFGATPFAAETYWSEVGDMAADGFSEADGETVIRGELMYGGFTFGASYLLDGETCYDPDLRDDATDATTEVCPVGDNDLIQMSLGATGDFGGFTFAAAYQEEIDASDMHTQIQADGTTSMVYNDNGDISADEIFAVRAGTSFAGADVALGFASNQTQDTNSTGISAAYPVGPVTVGGAYVLEDGGDTNDWYELTVDYAQGPITAAAYYENRVDGVDADEDFGIDVTYDVGNGITALAGVTDAGEDYYVAGQVALSDNASVTVSFADDGDSDADDEVGGPEYKDGATISATFNF